MFGSIGGFEILVLLAIGLLVFGPKRHPEMGRWVARGLTELRKAATDVKQAVEREADLGDVTRAAGNLRRAVDTEARRLFTDLEAEAAPAPGQPPAAKEAARAGEPRPEAGQEGGEPASEPRQPDRR